MKKILIITFLLLSIVGIYYYPSVSQTLNIATGFTAKNICSGHFVSGFDPETVAEEALKPINPAFNLVDYQVNETDKTVTTSVLGLFNRLAIYREGTGCTLLALGQENLFTKIEPLTFKKQSNSVPWPQGLAGVTENIKAIDYKLLHQGINKAFSEPNSLVAGKESDKRNVKAIAVIYKGQLIAERYAEDVDINSPLLGWSMAKSITSLQVALLVKDGKLDISKKTDVPAWTDASDARSDITLDQLMRMSSGLEFNETYGINTDVSRMLSTEINSGVYAASKPLEYGIDTHWSYSSGTTNIISGIVKRAIGGTFQDYYEYTQKGLFKPLSITTAISETDGSDSFIGSSYFYASARDWAKLGQLMLQNGQWQGQQLLPENWVEYSTTPTKTLQTNRYGAQFWLNQKPTAQGQPSVWPTAPSDTYYMGGYQGQYVIVIPSEELVIVRFGFSKPGVSRGIGQLISDTIAAVGSRLESVANAP